MTDADRMTDFIREHLETADVQRLLLSAAHFPGIDVPAAVRQIEALRRIRAKVPEWYDPALRFPPLVSVEQASSAATAQFKCGLVRGRCMADLSGGLGIDSYYFSKQFERVVYVEQDEDLVGLARHNFTRKDVGNVDFVASTAEAFLQNSRERFDLIYLDPARRDDRQERVFRLEDCHPNVVALRGQLLEKAPGVLVKAAPMLDISAAVAALQSVVGIWIVAVRDEVKEVLYLLERSGISPETIPLTAVNLESGQAAFRFTRSEEASAEPVLSVPQGWLYEPNAAILKAGAFRSFAARFGLAKLHRHTHLYTSDTWVPGVPGRGFRILSVCKYDRKAVQAALPAPKANISTRNFPDSVAQVRKRLALADGGDQYLFAVTDIEGLKVLVCEKAR